MNRDTAANARTQSDDDVLVRVEGVGKKFCRASPIQRAFRITADQRVEMFKPAHFNTRSQDLEEALIRQQDNS